MSYSGHREHSKDAAGSGKTSIVLHRIAFLLYRFKDTLSTDHILIISPAVSARNDATEMDRNLLYLGCTRAMHRVTLIANGGTRPPQVSAVRAHVLRWAFPQRWSMRLHSGER